MKKDTQNIQELWQALKTTRERYRPVWDEIAKFTGITVDPNYLTGGQAQTQAGNTNDQFIDDPTSAISVNQFGDYLLGIIWGTGDRAFDIIPSRYVLELADTSQVDGWYKFATAQTLYHMNHPAAGLHTALRPYSYDQASFGNSGIGTFPNQAFKNGIDDNALLFRSYGVDNTCIDEGKSGAPEVVFVTYKWRVNRIVGEFCMVDGAIDDKAVNKLPDKIKSAYLKGSYNDEFVIVFGVFPRADFDPKLKGSRGTRYRGVWFLDEPTQNSIFHEESFAERPIAWCRQVKVRGEVYGRSSGTMLMSTIRTVNFMVGTSIEILEKMSNPSLGMFNNAIFGDSVLDTSPNGLTVFNQALAGQGGNPLFPLYDVGDPSGIIEFLIPYLNEKITTAFKVDALLDFNSAKDMTATESLQRYAIRGKSLTGILQQQKIETLEPTSRRSISVLLSLGELGVDPTVDKARAKKLEALGKTERVIPEPVLAVMREGRPWFELKFNNELEKLTRTEAVQNLVQILQSITAIAALYPQIIEAVDWFKLLKDINDHLDYNNQILISADEFKDKLAQAAQMKAAAMAMQMGQAGATIQKDVATADKTKQEARSAKG